MSKLATGALITLVLALALAAGCGGGDGESDSPQVLVQAPGSKSAEDELAKIEAKTAGRLTEARVYHTATKLNDGRVLIAGSKGPGTMSMPGPVAIAS